LLDGQSYYWRVTAVDLGTLRTVATPAFWRFHFQGTVDVPALPPERLPVAAPNPARNVVVVRMSVREGAETAARVIDARGRVVADLGTLASSKGALEIRWDTTDRTGAPVASGRYWIEISPGIDGPRAVTPVVIVR
jgi:hypothetical protein